MTIKIEADIESTERIFTYSGADLLAPLSKLRETMLAEAKRLRDKLPANDRALPTISDLRGADTDAQAKHRIKLLLSGAFDAQLWAAEAKRTPAAVWRLTMADLRWLYQFEAPTTGE
jgi:hypothetical protein